MIMGGFNGQVLKEYENTYLIELEMKSVCSKDKVALLRIQGFNGRVVVAKKYVSELSEQSKFA
ncbi:hypothetical protein FC70_GL000085 [Paucilactobacillus oligofermentans DSM 15707 = LMG 22743]|uniref:Uncharacterized protein n=2 Tax=Paucilactobacillus oligofermentans TaxID=293371 RepID=A0A0R1RMG9_9LACO|nr:hypothetical protein FC70_GL000085 [Paucilactobacillus oligofermentans DSM 15707 = LMG 22743]